MNWTRTKNSAAVRLKTQAFYPHVQLVCEVVGTCPVLNRSDHLVSVKVTFSELRTSRMPAESDTVFAM